MEVDPSSADLAIGLSNEQEHLSDDLAWAKDVFHITPTLALQLPKPGEVLDGRLEIIKHLLPSPRGGMGKIYLARDVNLARLVALKVLMPHPRHVQRLDEMTQLFEREAKATARLNHPNIVTIYDHGTWNKLPYLVLERLEGNSLRTLMESRALSLSETISIMTQVLEALAYAHKRGIVHRDIKPNNIMVLDDGRVKVIDFGLAVLDFDRRSFQLAADQDALSLRSEVGQSPMGSGTPAYMAPEQWAGSQQDERTDIWACGVTLFELLMGHLPFGKAQAQKPQHQTPPPSVHERHPSHASQLDSVCRKALTFETSERYGSAKAMLAPLKALERVLSHRTELDGEPYRHLESFRQEDAPWYFGQKAEIGQLVHMLKTRPAVAVVGASGAGKSSLIQAGLLPKLSQDSRWLMLELAPGRFPLERLHEEISRTCGKEACLEHLPTSDVLLSSPGRAGKLLRDHAHATNCRILVVVDQFEELYTQVDDPAVRTAFANALFSLADDPTSPIRLIINIRDDFRFKLIETPDLHFALARSTLELRPPNAENLTAALCGPASLLGYEVEEALIATILQELADNSAPLPLLQVAATHLWDKRDTTRNLLTLESLESQGGISGILSIQADKVIEQLSNAQNVAVAKTMFTLLITEDRTKQAVEREQLLSHFEDQAHASHILEHLIHGRLLMSRKENTTIWIELTHEALLKYWKQLETWQEEDQHWRRFKARLSQSSEHWQERGQPNSLLWRGDTLGEALKRDLDGVSGLTPLEKKFIAVSASHTKTLQRLWRGVFVLMLLVASGISAVSYLGMKEYKQKEQQADEERRKARSRELAVHAREAGESDPMRSLLLARAAVEIHPTEQAISVIQQVLFNATQSIVVSKHIGPITSTEFHPDGQSVLTVSLDNTARLWTLDGTEITHLPFTTTQNQNWITGAAFSPDGQKLLTTHHGGTVLLRHFDRSDLTNPSRDEAKRDGLDLALKTQITLRGHKGEVLSARFGPDSKSVLTASTDHSARLWTLDGAQTAVLRGHENWVMTAIFGPEGKSILTASKDQTARLWNLDGTTKAVFRGHTGSLAMAVFSPDGKSILTASKDQTARLWNLDGTTKAVFRGHTDELLTAIFSPDGQTVLTASGDTGSMDQTARLWNLDGTTKAVMRGHRSSLTAAVFSPDGQTVLTTSKDQTARLWDLNGTEKAIFHDHKGELTSAVFGPDSETFLTGSMDHTARLWTLQDRKIERQTDSGIKGATQTVLRGHKDWITSVEFSPDGKTILTASADKVALLWGLDGTKKSAFRGHGDWVMSARFSPDGQAVVTAAGGMVLTSDPTARVWDLDGTEKAVLRGHESELFSAVFSPDGQTVLTTSKDQTARLWDLDGTERAVLRGHENWVLAAVFSPDGQTILTASRDKTARLWALDGTERAVLRGHDDWVGGVAFSPDGQTILTASSDHTARLWNLDGTERAVLRGHQHWLSSAVFSPDGQTILTSSRDQTARIWSLDGAEKAVLRGHTSDLFDAAFSPDGKTVATGSTDGTIRLWLIYPSELLELAKQRSSRALTPEERSRYGLD